MLEALCTRCHPRKQVRASGACALSFAVVALVLVLDIALQARPILVLRLQRHWWARPSQGCWLAESLCVPGRGGSEASLAVWRLETSERHCYEEAARYWRECMNPVRGFVVAKFGPHGQVVTRPETAAKNPKINPSLVSATLRGSPWLLIPSGFAWDIEICDGTAPCWQLPVRDFCDASTEDLQVLWPRLQAGCRAVHESSFPQCGPDTPNTVCAAYETAAKQLSGACEQLCPLANHAHQIFSSISVLVVFVVVVVASSMYMRRWRRHLGCIVSIVAIGGAGAAALTIILLSQLDVGLALQAAADLSEEGVQLQVGGVLLSVVASCMAVVAFVVIAASKSEKILQYRLAEYEKFNANLRDTSALKNLRRQQERCSNDEEQQPCSPARPAFEASGDEERIGYADGVLTRPHQAQTRQPGSSPSTSAKNEKPRVYGSASQGPQLEFGGILPNYRPVESSWLDTNLGSDSDESDGGYTPSAMTGQRSRGTTST